MDQRISQLPSASTLSPSDSLPIDQSGTTKQVPVSVLDVRYVPQATAIALAIALG